MTAAIVLVVYCGLIIVASLAGGYLPLVVRLEHRHLEMVISFVAGVILGVGALHLLPHAVEQMDAVEPAAAWMLGGFLLMFFLDRFFHFHRHETPAHEGAGEHGHEHGALSPCDHSPSHGCDHGPNVHGHSEPSAPEADATTLPNVGFSWSGAAVGMTIHSLVEGLALAAAVDAELHERTTFHWAGLGAFLAIVLHKPLDSLTVGTLMAVSRHPRRRRVLVNGLFAFAVPCGVAAFYFFISHAAGGEARWLGPALAFAAGAFLCIASSDLLPELHFHSHDRIKLSACLLLGVALSVGLTAIEHGGLHAHEHGHGPIERHVERPAGDAPDSAPR